MAISRNSVQSVALEETKLPENLHWYDVSGTVLLPLMSGPQSYTSDYIAYLIQSMPRGSADMGIGGLREDAMGRWFGVLVHMSDSREKIIAKVNNAVEALNGSSSAN